MSFTATTALFGSEPRSVKASQSCSLCRRAAWPLFGLLVLLHPLSLWADEVIPFVIQDSLYRTNLGISNLDPLPADVSILLHDNTGQLAAGGAIQVPGLGFVNLKEVVHFAFGQPSQLPFEGTIRLRSTRPIVAFASQIQYANNDPGIVPAVPDGSSAYILPVTTSIEPWSSTLAVVNLAPLATVVKISLRDDAGLLISELERGLPAASQWISANIHRDLGVEGVRGSLTIRSLDAAPLVAICRHTQTVTRQDVFQQPFDLKGAAKVFYLPYRFEKDLHRSWIVLNNLETEPAQVALRAFSPEGANLRDYSFQLPARGSILLPDSLFLAAQGDRALFGMVRGTSDRSLSGLVIQTNLATRDTIHTNIVTAWSPEVLIPSVTETSTFSSNLLVGNLGDTGTWIEISHRAPDGQSPVPSVKALLPARGSVYLDKVLASLRVQAGYGPLALRSIGGEPLAAFSHVMNTENGARGSLDWTDLRPSVSKRLGERVTLHWQYDSAEARKILEYRIYRADRAARNFRMIDRVPPNVLEHTLDARDTGTFVLAVRAFDGARESLSSNEVLLEVKP